MSRSDDPGHYFQTSDSIATGRRKAAKSKNDCGNPIRLPSKLLAVVPDAGSDLVYVAGADGLARAVDLTDRKTIVTFTGGAAPLTSLALLDLPSQRQLLFAGCWDKTIWSWDASTGKLYKRFTNGHTDFVKCILATKLAGKSILISGGADSNIIVWDVESGRKLHVLKGHARGVLDVSIDPTSSTADADSDGYTEIKLFSADSVREIRQWIITPDAASSASSDALIAHETSVNKLHFEVFPNVIEPENDLFTASSDKTVKRLIRSRNWEVDNVMEHPDHVRDVVAYSDMVATACRDEMVRLFIATSTHPCGELWGHYEEVTGLAFRGHGRTLVSVSLDGTIRQWGLDDRSLWHLAEDRRRWENCEKPEVEQPTPAITADEEAELAELMDSD